MEKAAIGFTERTGIRAPYPMSLKIATRQFRRKYHKSSQSLWIWESDEPPVPVLYVTSDVRWQFACMQPCLNAFIADFHRSGHEIEHSSHPMHNWTKWPAMRDKLKKALINTSKRKNASYPQKPHCSERNCISKWCVMPRSAKSDIALESQWQIRHAVIVASDCLDRQNQYHGLQKSKPVLNCTRKSLL
jgi:hypothetical protein